MATGYQGFPLILRPWSPDFDPDNIDAGKVPVWVLFPDLPYSLWNADAPGKMANAVNRCTKYDLVVTLDTKYYSESTQSQSINFLPIDAQTIHLL